MAKTMTTALVVLLLICGGARAETFTGPITSTFEGGATFQQIEVDGKWRVVGCGPDTDLPAELLEYLEAHWDQTGTVQGEAVEDPDLGACIKDPMLAADGEASVPRESPALETLARNAWVRVKPGLTDEEREIIATSLADAFWDPVFQMPISSFLGVCRYFHDRGFSVDVGLKYTPGDAKQPGSEVLHLVTVKVVKPSADMALELVLMVIYTNKALHAGVVEKHGETGAKSFVCLPDLRQTEQYHLGQWEVLGPYDWMEIMKSIIKEEYVGDPN